MNEFPILTVLTFAPLVGALLLLGLESRQTLLARRIALGFSVLALVFAFLLWRGFDRDSGALQFVERHSWIPQLGVEYFVGADGLGLLMILLTALVVPMAILISSRMEDKGPLYYSLLLMVQTGLFGTFTALNFFHWFIYWELTLIPAFFLVRLWGGAQRVGASTQFFVYTMFGSIAMLLAFLAIFLATGSFDFIRLAEMGRSGELAVALATKLNWGMSAGTLANVIFCGVLLGFAVKVPLMPFHTWLPATYAEAPTPVTMILTGVMSKMGVYGMLRIMLPLFPEQMRALMTPLLWLAVATIVFSACAAFAQKDFKRLLAYSSINHLGFCMLGIFAAARFTSEAAGGIEKAAALNGVLLQMFNHGITAAALFGFVGFLEYRSGGRRGLDEFGGLRKIAPVFCGLMGISMFASLGLPGLNGFVGEFLILKGAFPLATWATAISVLGLLMTAIFLLTALQRVFHGPLNAKWASMPDLTGSERWLVAPAIALMFVVGIYPQLLIEIVNPTVLLLVQHLNF